MPTERLAISTKASFVVSPDDPQEEGFLTTDALIADWLRSGRPSMAIRDETPEHLLLRMDLHGVSALLAEETSDWQGVPSTLREAMRGRLIARELWELRHMDVLRDALSALANAGVETLILKGSALAYSHYNVPSVRVRGDSDVLIPETQCDAAFAALKKAGFTSQGFGKGRIVSAERSFCKTDQGGKIQTIDLHWRLTSPSVIARAFPFEALSQDALGLPMIAKTARTVSSVNALLIACFHRRLHVGADVRYFLNGHDYETPDRLAWLVDIARLYAGLSDKERALFVQKAHDTGIASICRDTLALTDSRIGVPVTSDILTALEPQCDEPIARFLTASSARRYVMNFAATQGLRRKAQFARETLFPPTAYMRDRFGRDGTQSLSRLYLRRLIYGVRTILLGRHA